MADGPKRSRHRFYWSRPSSLCLYYGRDHESLQWLPSDGLVGLVDLARLHLMKEIWWRATGEWPGLEFHRRPPLGNEQHAVKRRTFDAIRRSRQQCWCGESRYSACHGAIPPDEELEELGLR